MIRKLSISTLLAVFFLSLSFYGCSVSLVSAATETSHETYQVEPGSQFELRNRNGDVSIQQWHRAYVEVTAEKKTRWGGNLEDVTINVTHDDGVMRVETIDLVEHSKVSVSYHIQVPAEILVTHVSTSNGKIEIEETQGDITVKTSNGKIEIEEVTGNIQAKTSNGDIDIKEIAGYVSAETSNGSVEIKEVTGLGNIKTSNGSIKAEIPAIRDDVQIKTSNGSVKLFLSPQLNATVEMKTSNGKIALHDLEIIAKEISTTSLTGKIGEGEHNLSVKTSNGKIDLHNLE